MERRSFLALAPLAALAAVFRSPEPEPIPETAAYGFQMADEWGTVTVGGSADVRMTNVTLTNNTGTQWTYTTASL